MNPFAFNANRGGKACNGLFLLTLISLFFPSLLQAEPVIVRIIPEYREAVTFQRISEFFTGRENPGRQRILRTDPEERTGFYWTIRLRRGSQDVLAGGAIRIEVFYPANPRPEEYSLDLPPLDSRRPLLLAGITGEDWPEEISRPLAWKLSFLDKEGNVVLSEQSFLWAPDETDE